MENKITGTFQGLKGLTYTITIEGKEIKFIDSIGKSLTWHLSDSNIKEVHSLNVEVKRRVRAEKALKGYILEVA